MHGIAIKRLGHNVHLLERTLTSLRDGQGAGISAGPQVQEFLKKHDLSRQPYSLLSPAMQFVDKELNVKEVRRFPLRMTGWNVLYYRLRANFDGLKSDYCPEPPKSIEGEGKAIYDLGKRVTDVSYVDGLVTVEFEDLVNGGGRSLHADLVIAADGSSSGIRQLLFPNIQRAYAGYLAWRGTSGYFTYLLSEIPYRLELAAQRWGRS